MSIPHPVPVGDEAVQPDRVLLRLPPVPCKENGYFAVVLMLEKLLLLDADNRTPKLLGLLAITLETELPVEETK